MKKALVCIAVFAAFSSLSHAATAIVVSPDSAQTFSYSCILDKQLRLSPNGSDLIASITFSNYQYASIMEPRCDERFSFEFPGVTFDRASGVFFARGEHGLRVPVAALQRELIGKSIK